MSDQLPLSRVEAAELATDERAATPDERRRILGYLVSIMPIETVDAWLAEIHRAYGDRLRRMR